VRSEVKRVIMPGMIVAVATMLVYLGSLSCGFINLDDPYYITNNALIRGLDGEHLLRIFTAPHLGNWLPLTYVSFAIDYHFWGDNPAGYHLTNIVLHSANAGLVVLIADGLLKGRREMSVEGKDCSTLIGSSQLSAVNLYPGMLLLAGLLFALHPLRVESVAWAAARKDTLNGLFTLSSLLAYLRFVRLQEAGESRYKWLGAYLLALAFFTCSLLSKQVSVTIPVILLLLDWYPLSRLQRKKFMAISAEKIPFFAISLLITLLVLFIAAEEKILISTRDMPLYVRVLVSGNAVFEYCRLSLFPIGISPYFVLPKPLPYGYLVKTAAVAALSLFLLWRAPRRPAVAATWFAFVILLAPMLAFLHAGDDIALAARYTYLPAVAASIAAAAGLMLLAARLKAAGRRLAATLLLGSVTLCLGVGTGITLRLIKVWQDTSTFWSRVIEIEPVGRAYGDRGVFYLINGRSAEAAGDFSAAIDIAVSTGLASVYNLYAFRGVAFSDVGRYAESVADFDRAIGMYPHPTYFQQRGLALKALGREAEAEDDFRRAGPNPPLIDWFEKGR